MTVKITVPRLYPLIHLLIFLAPGLQPLRRLVKNLGKTQGILDIMAQTEIIVSESISVFLENQFIEKSGVRLFFIFGMHLEPFAGQDHIGIYISHGILRYDIRFTAATRNRRKDSHRQDDICDTGRHAISIELRILS